MRYFYQILLVVSSLLLAWLGMMAVHELGHCVNAWLSGGSVARVVLHPLAISRTDLARNPHPQFTAWGGALWGCAIPLAVALAMRIFRAPGAYLARFFAGFCLLLNGVYLAEDAFFRAADGGDLVRHGAPAWTLVASGAAAMAIGLALLNGLGPRFGFGEARGRVDRRAALGVTCALAVVVLIEVML
jgi:hypothetical protein